MKSRGLRFSALCCAAVILGAAVTSAEVFAETREVEVTGEVASTATSARVRAIDAALVEAVSRTLADEVAAPVRRRYSKTLNEQVVRHARRYVAGFTVLDQGESEGRLRLRLMARVDVDMLRATLGELGIALATARVARPRGPRPRLVVLVHATVGNDTTATFGQGGDNPGPAGQALMHALREHGFELARAAGHAVPVSRETPAGVPLADDAAAEIARQAGAGGALVVGLEARPDGVIRGTRLVGARGSATVRVLDTSGASVDLVARARITGAGFAGSMDQALAAAAETLVSRLMVAIAPDLAETWPPDLAAGDEMLVAVEGFSGWRHVRALMDHLSGTRGIDRVWPRHLGQRGVILGVDTKLDRRRVAAALRRADVEGGQVSVSSRGDSGLTVSIQAAGDAQP